MQYLKQISRQALVLSLFAFVTVAANASSSNSEWNNKIYVGMAYPSGNVYLRSFSDSDDSKKKSLKWSVNVVYFTFPFINNNKIINRKTVGHADFKGMAKNIYVPGIEGYDDKHNKPCKWKYKATRLKKDMAYSDFFSTVFDHCAHEFAIGKYKQSKNIVGPSYIIAFDSTSKPEKIDTSVYRKARPATKQELLSIAKMKAGFKKENPNFQCSTVKRYIDSAKQRAIVSFKNSSNKIRLSHYSDPGCAGHLSEIWIADILKKEKVIKTYIIYHYYGAI